MARRGQIERTDEIIQRILDELTDGRTLSSICTDAGMPTRRLPRLKPAPPVLAACPSACQPFLTR